MFNKLMITVAAAALALGISCASTGYGPGGSIFTSTKIGMYGKQTGGQKVGQSCVTSILGWVATGDGSVDSAAGNAGITEVYTINLEGFSVLGLYSELCTVVAGQ